jgi:raffinose/stachyose/melibiose transport system substrate-binding protein
MATKLKPVHLRSLDSATRPGEITRRRVLKNLAVGSALAAGAQFTPRARSVNAQEPVTLSFWSEWSADPERSVADALVEQFNAANPNIVIEHRPIENEQFFTVLRTGFTSGEPPDIFQHEGHNNLFQFSDLDEVEPIDDFWAENGDRFLPGTDASIKKGDTYFGVPWTIHTDTQIYYNAKLLTDNGIDGTSLATWDDYLAAFAALKAAGVTPIAFANKFGWSGSQWFFAFLVREVGVDPVLDLCARVGDYKWTDPGFVAAAQHYVDLNSSDFFSTGKASDDFPAAVALFFAGRAGFFQTGSWFLADAQASAPPDFQLGLNTFPTIEGGEGDPKQIVMQGLEGISVSKKGAEKNREAALAFIDFLTQVPQAETWVKDSVKISPIAGAVNDETASENLMKIVEGQIDGNTGSFPFLEHILPKTVGEEAIWMGSVGVLTGDLTAETWMESVEAAAESEPPVIER